MAKPIQPTPTLKGKDAERFLLLTEKVERNPDRKRALFLRECLAVYESHKF
ncbi:MAG: hypothetical protein V1834_00570 [Candidatus Micrarchaeota archaeon]